MYSEYDALLDDVEDQLCTAHLMHEQCMWNLKQYAGADSGLVAKMKVHVDIASALLATAEMNYYRVSHKGQLQ